MKHNTGKENKRKRLRWLRNGVCLIAAFLLTYHAMMLPALSMEEDASQETSADETTIAPVAAASEAPLSEATELPGEAPEESFTEGETVPADSEKTQLLRGTEVTTNYLSLTLLYPAQETQDQCPEGYSYYTHTTMSGFFQLTPVNLESNLTDVTVTLTVPKQYAENLNIPPFTSESEITRFEIQSVTEDETNYYASVLFTAYDQTQTMVIPFTLSFKDDIVPDDYVLPLTGTISYGDYTYTTEPNLYKPVYKPWQIVKYVNSNKLPVFAEDGAHAVVTPLEEDGNPYLDDLTYVHFAFVVNNALSATSDLNDYRDATEVTLTDTLPTYTDVNGNPRIAAFDAGQNPGWTLSEDGTTISKTYTGANSNDVLYQISQDEIKLRFPGLPFETDAEGNFYADLTNTVSLLAIPSNASEGETRPEVSDDLLFRLTDDPSTEGKFDKKALKGDIYDVNSYKTNPYPWRLTLSNANIQPLRNVVISDRKILKDDGSVDTAGLDEALKFVRLESETLYSKLPAGKTFADLVDYVRAYYTDGTTEDFYVTEVNAKGDFTVTFNETKICDGYEIFFDTAYEMQAGEATAFLAYTVYRDPDNTVVPEGTEKLTYTNQARVMNSYQKGEATVYKFMWRSFSYDMLPSAEKITITKKTSGNGDGSNMPGQYFEYYITLNASLLEETVKEYGEVCIVDLLPDGVHYPTIAEYRADNNNNGYPIFVNGGSRAHLFDENNRYVPEIIENYHNSGRTAVIFHIKESNLRKVLLEYKGKADLAFHVKINDNAHSGTITNYVYVVGDNLEEYREPTGGTLDIYDLNNNGRTDDMIAYDDSLATIVASQSLYAEKFIARAGTEAWQKQGLYLSVGSEFDYLLKITNETPNEHSGLLVYDTLPRINDDNIFNTATRNSQFPVYLRSAITPPAGYTVYYTASESVYDNSMDGILADDSVSWMAEAEVSDWTAVTAFKITANDETVVLGGASTFEVTVPVRVVSMLSEESLAFLQGKVHENTKSGTMVYLQSNNTFGFQADDLGTAESNSVWARIPFAGFKLKKVDATDGTIVLPGAVFELRNAEGTLLQTVTTGADGFAKFENLTEGVYTLTETVVPNDYREDMARTLTVTITQSDATGLYYFDFGKGYTGTGTSTDPLLVKNVPFADFTLKKVDGRDGTTALANAEFTLTDAEGNLLQTVTTGADGLASFDHLTDGVYTLTETKVPDGYRDVNLTLTVRVYWDSEAGQYEFIFDEGYTGAGTAADPLILENETGYELPATGGNGIQMYTMGGLLLIGASAILLLYKKFRRGKEEEYSS